MTERAWRFGDVVRIDPVNPKVPQPDDRRWMVVSKPRPDGTSKWTLIYLSADSASGVLTHWLNTFGYMLAEDDD